MDILAGQMFVYHEDRRLVAFRTGPPGCRRYVICVGGGAGAGPCAPLALPYVQSLSSQLNEHEWCLVQPVLSSSGLGLGITDGWQDFEEIDALVACLLDRKASNIILFGGQSTGCRIVVQYQEHGTHRDKVGAIILQSPVSARQYMEMADSQHEGVAAGVGSNGEGGDGGLHKTVLGQAEQLVLEGRGTEVRAGSWVMLPPLILSSTSFSCIVGFPKFVS